MTNDEHYALELHKQLNAIPLRRRERRGPTDVTAQQTLERLKKEKDKEKQGKQRTKRTNSSSQDHPSSKRRRNSDPDGDGPTSAHQTKREPAESNQSHPGYYEQQQAPRSKVKVEPKAKQCDSRDSGMHPAAQRQIDHVDDMQSCSPGQAAALLAAQTTREQLKPPPNGELLLQQ
eukprot:GHUV01018432.1.p1 GENE.GHUV01018432.1~~GHUV01018432.1.p1  ORF type:complete len:175 (+),score=54.19 GHUV01018432.1:418-942(+)